ncbi:hypothetical protein [Nonomuraea sp. 10N515B]|uniref:hypothetical protein n=1 Tax=Nonomuraea sp. 10N515B TaxID=3457422 RepID=UPI003FCC90B7
MMKHLVMDLEEVGCGARYLTHDRGGKFPVLLQEILDEVGIESVLTGIRMPRTKSIMERVQLSRRELIDRCQP